MTKRVKQFTFAIVTVLALLASSVSACTCSHHEAEVKPEIPSCHHHSEMADDDAGNCLSSDDDCVCAANGEQIVAKSEAGKLKKHNVLAAAESPVFRQVSQTERHVKFGFVKPSYLSDSFYNLSPSRGPPRLYNRTFNI